MPEKVFVVIERTYRYGEKPVDKILKRQGTFGSLAEAAEAALELNNLAAEWSGSYDGHLQKEPGPMYLATEITTLDTSEL